MRRFFRDQDRGSSLFWAVVGVFFCVGGLNYGLKQSGIPGPGFLPFLAGLILVSLSLLLFLSTFLRKTGAVSEGKALSPSREGLRKIIQALLSLCFYVLAVEQLGFFMTAFLFMVLILRLEPRKWIFIVPCALGSTAFFYILFKVVLGVPLPRGILGF